ncbi:MAG: DUF2802 domain-containing protein [Rhodocyclaceae bacterium]|nr:DUF2802 domain-containing protein [Rhodocyclaceae bacterium]
MEIAGITLGLREGVVFLIALVAIYMVFVIIRLRRPPVAQRVVPAAPVPVVTPKPEPEPEPEPELPAAPAMNEWERAAAAVPPEERLYRNLENEVFQLRDEVDTLRGELAALRVDMLQELGHMRASQSVSPIYGDAMQMAASGYDPAMIAERCGIARAEAELVVALAKSQNA